MIHKLYQYLLKNQVIMALFIIFIVWFIVQARSMLVALFVAYIIMAALVPLVGFLRKKGLPKVLSVVIAYFSVMILLVVLIFPLIPFFLGQIEALITGLPVYLNESAKMFGMDINTEQVQQYVGREIDNIGKNAFLVTKQVFGGVFSSLTIFIVSFYLLMDHEKFRKWLSKQFHRDVRPRVLEAMQEVDEKLGSWLRGQILLSLFIGALTWVFLMIVGLPYALPLALLAGLLEVVPTLGPILASIPAIVVALTVSPTLALVIIIGYLVIQLLENNILVPKIMQRAVGLNPVIVILAVMTGANMMGIAGALLSVPFVSFLILLFNSLNKTDE